MSETFKAETFGCNSNKNWLFLMIFSCLACKIIDVRNQALDGQKGSRERKIYKSARKVGLGKTDAYAYSCIVLKNEELIKKKQQ